MERGTEMDESQDARAALKLTQICQSSYSCTRNLEIATEERPSSLAYPWALGLRSRAPRPFFLFASSRPVLTVLTENQPAIVGSRGLTPDMSLHVADKVCCAHHQFQFVTI